MTANTATARRLLRREARATRRGPAIALAVVLTVLLLVLLGGTVGGSLDEGFRTQVRAWFASVAAIAHTAPALLTAGAVLVALALLLLGAAVLPGRRARRTRLDARAALVIDDGVLADAVADGVARRLGVPRGQTSVTVGRRTVLIRVTPTSGVPVDPAAAEDAAGRVLDEAGFRLSPRVQVAPEGVIA
ncbi:MULTISPECIES: hypothetical protein [unclassified Microbacterium]|uniref:hypothetical protein n=1 Tax=unclassified Microbacterium TaxID=2609290 RepID=UPI0025D55F5C|nr:MULTISPECIES: hypothetical protein [unclassified Microbacterium]